MCPINLMDDPGPRAGSGGGGGFLGVGWHTVQVRAFEEKSSSKGTPGIQYTLGNASGTIRKTFWLSPQAKFRLRLFAQACGLADVKLRSFDWKDLLNKSVQIEVTQGPQYKEVENWMPVGAAPFGADDDGDEAPL